MIDYDPVYLGDLKHTNRMFGLYEPISDLFMGVGADLESLFEISFLFSSRYILYICEISGARNYSHRLLDNRVCHQWTVNNPEDFAITRFPDLYSVTKVTEIVSKSDSPPWNFKNDHKYIKLAYVILSQVIPALQYKSKSIGHGSGNNTYSPEALRLKNKVESLPGIPFTDQYSDAIDQLLTIIYTEFNVNTAMSKIIPLLDLIKWYA